MLSTRPVDKIYRWVGKVVLFIIWVTTFEVAHLVVYSELYRISVADLVFSIWVAIYTIFLVDMTQREKLASRPPAPIRRIK